MPEQDLEQTVTQNVADGQSVVDAVAADTQAIVNDAVDRMGIMLAEQSEGEQVEQYTTIDDAQWSQLQTHLRAATTCAFFSAVAAMCVFGAVVSTNFVRGWRSNG